MFLSFNNTFLVLPLWHSRVKYVFGVKPPDMARASLYMRRHGARPVGWMWDSTRRPVGLLVCLDAH